MSATFSPEEIAKHNTEKDLWIVYNGSVYDITKFYTEHPGGEEVLLDLAGKDATTCFDDIGHSGEAIILRETFKIGTVGGGTVPSSSNKSPGGVQDTTIDDDNWVYEPPKQESSSWNPVFVAIIVAIYALIIYYMLFVNPPWL